MTSRLDLLQTQAKRVQAASDTGRREAHRVVFLKLATQAKGEQDDLYRWLWDADNWLWANADHPEREQYDDRWIATLRRYEAICDALLASERGLD